ncbi:LADA_0A06216g1_1 [Lachancea dasiensis]|uniref:LADA_0A06216g1_1 n=1 Tax=Lachancea dasiensis TaxID=1072105 RepID=A0A1G4IPH3_9SACH|nr:LADA_0A06216g1_1 [Lachancea dasiensis]
METDDMISTSERLQLLMDDHGGGNETNGKPAASLLDYLVRKLEKERLAEVQLTNSEMPVRTQKVESDFNDDIIASPGSHYTSFIPPRPYAEHFDFDGGQGDFVTSSSGVQTQGYNDVVLSERHIEIEDSRPRSERAKVFGENENEENNDGAPDQNLSPDHGREVDLQSNDIVDEESAQLVVDKLNIFKSEFRRLIQKIDDASLLTHMSDPFLPVDSEFSPRPMNSMMAGILDTLQSLPSTGSGRKRPRSSSGVAQTEGPPLMRRSPARDAQLKEPPSISEIEQDPCFGLANFGVVLVKSPVTVAQLWNEYTKLPSEWALPDWFEVVSQQHSSEKHEAQSAVQVMKRRTSIRDLERTYGSSWRNNDKNFSRQVNRRKKIWLAIEEGLQDGISLNDCFQLMETYVKERGKGLSWYYNGVPFKIKDLKRV